MKNVRNFYSVLLCAVCCAFGVAVFQGCTSTVTPDIVTPAQPSYSGSTRNSGIIARQDDGWVVDGTFRNRYNALIEVYGDEYNVRRDEGISLITAARTPDQERWHIDHRHFVLMITMNIKKHSGIAPTK